MKRPCDSIFAIEHRMSIHLGSLRAHRQHRSNSFGKVHHVFPWNLRSELKQLYDISKLFIDVLSFNFRFVERIAKQRNAGCSVRGGCRLHVCSANRRCVETAPCAAAISSTRLYCLLKLIFHYRSLVQHRSNSNVFCGEKLLAWFLCRCLWCVCVPSACCVGQRGR